MHTDKLQHVSQTMDILLNPFENLLRNFSLTPHILFISNTITSLKELQKLHKVNIISAVLEVIIYI